MAADIQVDPVDAIFNSVEAFLESCHTSAAQAYGNFKAILARLDEPSKRAEARRFLSQIENALASVDDALSYYHCQFWDLPLSRGANFDDSGGYFAGKPHAASGQPGVDQDVKGEENACGHAHAQLVSSDREPSPHRYLDAAEDETSEWSGSLKSVKMLVLPSIFVPENWSFTFYEGLRRAPRAYFAGREVVELGTGNGWISIAVAMEACPRQIIGLDINPRAVICARINLYLNALQPDGSPLPGPWSQPAAKTSSDEYYRSSGNSTPASAPRTLLDIVEFHESDLLGWCLRRGMAADTIIGCIPQVLNPDPDAMRKIITENQSEEFLYDLSNYCGLQGYVEDQFGLGLIARTLEESVEVLRPSGVTSGHLLLNLGGRPGMAVLEKMFRRRGWHIRKLWQTRVTQATDTDIHSLVAIEEATQRSRVRFEFYMGDIAPEPISARTALAYGTAGGQITHGLFVFNAHLRHPLMVRSIFRLLKCEGYADASSSLDLDYGSSSGPTSDYAKFEVADEKIAFLAHLSRAFRRPDSDLKRQIAAPDPAGSPHFRSALASYFRLYYHVPLSSANICVLPSRVAAMRLVLDIYKPELALVSAQLALLLPAATPRRAVSDDEVGLADASGNNGSTVWLQQQCHTASSASVLEAPQSAELLVRLIRSLKPQVVICELSETESRLPAAFAEVISASSDVGARIFIDISDTVALSSTPTPNGLLQHIARQALPPNVTIFCGLTMDRAYSDIEVGFVISENETFLGQLASAMSLTYGGTPVMSQVYYHAIVAEMLHFQIERGARAPTRPLVKEEASSAFIPLHPQAKYALALGHQASLATTDASIVPPTKQHKASPEDIAAAPTAGAAKSGLSAALANSYRDHHGENVHADHAMSSTADKPGLPATGTSLPMPPEILSALFESFARRMVGESEADPSVEIHHFLELQLGYGCLGEYNAVVAPRVAAPYAAAGQGALSGSAPTGGSLPRSSVLPRPRSTALLSSGTPGTSGGGFVGGAGGSANVVSVLPPVQLVWGGGATSLLADVFAACAAERGILVLPPGTPERILGIAAFAGTAVAGIRGLLGHDAATNAGNPHASSMAGAPIAVPGADTGNSTTSATHFATSKLSLKLTTQILERALCELTGMNHPTGVGKPACHAHAARQHHKHRSVWLYLPLPSVTSTGETYSPAEVRALVHVCIRHRTRIVLDTTSLGLAFGDPVPPDPTAAGADTTTGKAGKSQWKSGDRYLLDEYLHGGVVSHSVGTLDGDAEAAALAPSSPSSSISSSDDSAGGLYTQLRSGDSSPTQASAAAATAASAAATTATSAAALRCPHAVVVGDVSQLLSTGGLQFGFAVTRDAELAGWLREHCVSVPHVTTLFAMKKAFGWLINEASPLRRRLASNLAMLARRASSLSDALANARWEVLPPLCGLHLVARPGQEGVPSGGQLQALLSSLSVAPLSLVSLSRAATGGNTVEWAAGYPSTGLAPLSESGPRGSLDTLKGNISPASLDIYRFPLCLEDDKFDQLLRALERV
eukprot:jgi/Mesvir1/26878/Mv20615-RA.3